MSTVNMAHQTNIATYKVILVGDFGVGKTTFFKRAKEKDCALASPSNSRSGTCNTPISTTSRSLVYAGIDRCEMKLTMDDGSQVQIDLWDTGSTEQYHTVTKNYYNRASAAILMYDANDPATLSSLADWLEDTQRYIQDKAVYMLLSNKCDRPDEIDFSTATSFAHVHNIPLHFKISAKTCSQDQITEIFLRLVQCLQKEHTLQNRDSQTLQLHITYNQSNQSTAPLIDGSRFSDPPRRCPLCVLM